MNDRGATVTGVIKTVRTRITPSEVGRLIAIKMLPTSVIVSFVSVLFISIHMNLKSLFILAMITENIIISLVLLVLGMEVLLSSLIPQFSQHHS